MRGSHARHTTIPAALLSAGLVDCSDRTTKARQRLTKRPHQRHHRHGSASPTGTSNPSRPDSSPTPGLHQRDWVAGRVPPGLASRPSTAPKAQAKLSVDRGNVRYIQGTPGQTLGLVEPGRKMPTPARHGHRSSSRPIFVDRSGRRQRLVRRIGIGVALLAVAYGMILIPLSLVGVHINAPGLPLVEQLSRGAAAPSRNRPAAPTSSATVSESPAPPGSPAQRTHSAMPRPESGATRADRPKASADVTSPGTAPTSTKAQPVAAPTTQQSPTTSSPATSASSSTQATSSPSAATTTSAAGNSKAAQGATHRAVPDKGKSTTAPGGSRRSAAPGRDKKDTEITTTVTSGSTRQPSTR